MLTSELLRRAKELPYTSGELARDSDGNAVEPLDNCAVEFCAIGAVEKAGGAVRINARGYLWLAMPDGLVDAAEYSDSLANDPEARAAWWDQAIAMAEQDEAKRAAARAVVL